MASVRGRGNASTEGVLVDLFRSAGLRGWRRHVSLPGRPDFSFRVAKVAVFVDGCFWHGCPRCGRVPASNVAYWREKIARNRRRDRAASQALRRRGWKSVRVWEHSLRRLAAQRRVVLRLKRVLRGTRERGEG